ncbi:MAG: carboxypeptidase M32 [Chrysiogenales bacterium]|nr:MAG: carboxypeptidase M32 [Chrysiogenales bacterium]
MVTKLDEFKGEWARISRLEQAIAVLNWDMETFMPEEGVTPRSEQLALLSELAHEWLTSEKMARLIEDSEKEVEDDDYFSHDAAMVRAARRIYNKKARLPHELVSRFARTIAKSNSVWIRARADSDFPSFAPILSEIVDLNREQADLLGHEGERYDALLDLYEPGLKTAETERIFTELKKDLIPLVRETISRHSGPDDAFLNQKFPVDRQEAFGMEVLRDLGFDFRRGRQDRSAHPFTTSFTPYDVRITTRFFENDLLSALFSTIHEAGHALYDQGLPLDMMDTPLCQPISLGVHESQSRLWENLVGRSRGFWNHYLPLLKRNFPGQLDHVDGETFYRAVNRVRPGLIRVESDELTYNLHIFIRFEIEKELVAGRLSVNDIPEIWNESYRDYLGMIPPDDARGCLQDIHWAHGAIGYFPTYTIGNILSAQLYRKALDDRPAIQSEIETGRFALLLGWLRENVHVHGARYTFAEIVKTITGNDLIVKPYFEYLADKYRGI